MITETKSNISPVASHTGSRREVVSMLVVWEELESLAEETTKSLVLEADVSR